MAQMSVPSVDQIDSASESVVESVAAREGVDPLDLDVPLFDVIDPDALDRLVRSAVDGGGRPPIRIAFTYYGYDVIVTSDGLVHVSRENSTS